jgi:hypothetical protein
MKQTRLYRLYKVSRPIRRVRKSVRYRLKHIFEEIFVNIVQVKLIRINKHNWAIILTDRATRYRWSKTYVYKKIVLLILS